MEKEKRNNGLKKTYLLILTFILLLGFSYAIFSYLKLGEKTNIVKTGFLIIKIDDSIGKAIHVENAYPVTDEIGKTSDPYKFTITNQGTIDANYELRLISDLDAINECGCDKKNTIANSIKYEYKKTTSTSSTISNIQFLSNKNDWSKTSLETGTIKAGETISYELRLWIDEDTTSSEANKHLHAKVEVEAVQYTESIK